MTHRKMMVAFFRELRAQVTATHDSKESHAIKLRQTRFSQLIKEPYRASQKLTKYIVTQFIQSVLDREVNPDELKTLESLLRDPLWAASHTAFISQESRRANLRAIDKSQRETRDGIWYGRSALDGGRRSKY